MKNCLRCLRRIGAALCVTAMLITSVSALSVEDALSLLEDRYVNEIPAAAYEAETLDELFALIGDPYTYYMTAEEYQAFLDSVEGNDSVTGIGAGINYTENGILIASILSGGGAEDAGLVPGDLIIAVEGVSCVPADESHRVMIVGEEGTYVNLTVQHEDGSVEDYSIERRFIEIHNTNTTLDNGVGYIDCDSFGTETGTYFKEGITTYDDDAHIWVVDLRSNSGGVTTSAIESLGTFVGSGPLLYFRDRSGDYYYNVCFDDPITESPAIVLTNLYSASASEVFAAGIRDMGAGISVGTRTYGKGVAQTVLDSDNTPEYFDGDALKVTVYRFYSPTGNTTDKIGVIPTLLVDAAHTAEVAELLCAEEPSEPDGYLMLHLAGWNFYIDLEQAQAEHSEALKVLISALAPDAAVYLGSNDSWVPITTAMATTLCDAGEYSRFFTDLAYSDYAAEINTLAAYGILRGDGDGTFDAEDTLTRAELCAMLSQALDVTTSAEGYFTDVSSQRWYAGAVNTMASMGLVNGVGDGTFNPNGTMTQEEFITIMGRLAAFLNFNAYEYANSLSQEDLAADERYAGLSSWARTGASMLTEMMIDGEDNPINLLYDDLSAIDPEAPITREQAAATLCNLLKTMGFIVY